LILGVLFAFAAAAWNGLRKYLSPEGDQIINDFAKRGPVWAFVIFIAAEAILLSRFVEERRWPFSYRADPAIYETAQANQNDAAKWRFSYNLRYAPRAANNSLLTCKFTLVLSPGQNALNLWSTLQPMLELAHWESTPQSGQGKSETPFQGISILSGDNKDATSCGTELGKEIGSAFPQAKISLRTYQVSPALVTCKNECVELDLGN
jgi:hypothetical protein